MVIPDYHIFSPDRPGTFGAQWEQCLLQYQTWLADNPSQKPFIVSVFVDAVNASEFEEFENQIKGDCIVWEVPFAVVSQSPEKPALVIIEAGFVDTRHFTVSYGQSQGIAFCKVSNAIYNEYWVAGVRGNAVPGLVASAENAFRQLHSLLSDLKLSFNQIVRQWNSIEKIFDFHTIENKNRQNYQLFNEARHASYSKYRTVKGFPAATGIGCDWGTINVNCLLIPDAEGINIVSVGSPVQIDSYKYGQLVLKGDPDKNKTINQVPQFERAKLVCDSTSCRLFVSGTASIVGQETIGIGDVEKQTRVTLDNIRLLASEENLKSYFLDLQALPTKFACARVYVRYRDDIPKVRAICEAYFGQIPAVYVKADICRENLLVEIEAEMHSE